jgi:hypothetical protein
MNDDATALLSREQRAARRLVRLFRIERVGRFANRPAETVQRLIERRGLLVEELARLEARRKSLAPSTTVELDLVLRTLAMEVDRAEQWCLERLAELGAELARRRGAGTATGLRDSADGRLLGHG